MKYFEKEELPIGIQMVIDSNYDTFNYAVIEEHSTSLFNENNECYAVIMEEDYDF